MSVEKLELIYSIGLHGKDLVILKQIQKFLGVGSISKQGSHSIKFVVRSTKDLAVIINHFNKYPLLTKKI